uniref:Metallo-beta-lactamase domain-containing protein n=1 Tax=Oryza glumipatula TaxID=40148 RepID=A0A0E0BV94_9ORYZ
MAGGCRRMCRRRRRRVFDENRGGVRTSGQGREASSSPPMAASVPNGHSVAGEGGTPAPPPSSSSLVFLGTGCSSAVPNARCLIQPPDPPCAVCSQSLSVPPELNPNYRCNTSLLIDYCQDEVTHKYILIDVGKTFREQIILTHEHADAILGLDDVRIVQPFSPTNDIEPTPIYLSQFAMNSIAQKFPYLVRKKLKEGEEVRRVAQLDWRVIESDLQKPFVTSGLEFVPLPVIHGEDYVCLGFLFGRKSKVAYISDVSRFPPSTEHAISKSGEGQLDLLILDCLYRVPICKTTSQTISASSLLPLIPFPFLFPPLTDSPSSSSPRSPAERREASSSPPMAASVPNGHSVAGEGGTPAPPPSSSSLVFLGTGCSSAVPNARCLIQPPDPPCAVCSQSLSVPPELNPNYRYTSFFHLVLTSIL